MSRSRSVSEGSRSFSKSNDGGSLEIVLGQEAEQCLDIGDGVVLVSGQIVGVPDLVL